MGQFWEAKTAPLTARKRSTIEGEGPAAEIDTTGKRALSQREEPRLREDRGRGKHGGKATQNWGEHNVTSQITVHITNNIE